MSQIKFSFSLARILIGAGCGSMLLGGVLEHMPPFAAGMMVVGVGILLWMMEDMADQRQ